MISTNEFNKYIFVLCAITLSITFVSVWPKVWVVRLLDFICEFPLVVEKKVSLEEIKGQIAKLKTFSKLLNIGSFYKSYGTKKKTS